PVSMASSGHNVYLAWGKDINTYEPSFPFISASQDDGSSFSTPVQTTKSVSAYEPHVASSGSNVYLLWDGFSLVSNTEGIWIQTVSSDGTRMGTPSLISNRGGFDFEQIGSSLNGLQAIWSGVDDVIGKNDIFFRGEIPCNANKAPIAVSGPNQQVKGGQLVTLNGTAS